jgi:D-alanyl-D-alanine carboxypeptidase
MKDYQAVSKRIAKQLRKRSKPFFQGGKLLIIPLVFFLLFLLVYHIHISLEKELAKFDISSFTEIASVAPYPILHSVYTPFLTAQAAAVMDEESKVFLYVKNPQLRFSMASTTKLMTALIAVEEFSPDEPLFVYSEGVEGSVAGLRKGEQYTLESLLYALLLPSANDAAYTLADNYPGGRAAFVARMNTKASEFHLRDTHYDDPAGLMDDGNFTTVVDLAHLSAIAITNETIARITGTKEKIVTDVTGTHVLALENLNKLLGEKGVIGIKTGFTQGAGGVLSTAKRENGHTIILIVMRSLDRFADTEQLITLVHGKVSYLTPVYPQVSAQSN